VLVNLGGNAVKFTDRGQVTLRVASLGSADGSIAIRLEVVDTGVGIEPANQAKIFEEFTQEDASTTRRFGGTGLGLSIARQIVELMHGKLGVVSAPGSGSTFSFELTLPLAEPLTQLSTLPSLHPLRVLVVDGNSVARGIIVKTLREWGARPMGVGLMAEAAEQLRVIAYDAIIVDDSLAEDGALLLSAGLAERTVRPRIIRLTNFVSLARPKADGGLHFDAELSKPLRLQQLYRELSSRARDVGDRHVAMNPSAAQSAPRLRGRVLVVEDQALNREVAEGMLAALGLQSAIANDGRQALDMLAVDKFDVVLMDCQMPIMDGFSATAELRRREGAGARMPVIALTANATHEGRDACLAAGMDDYLAKPFSRAALHAVLARWLPAEAAREPAPVEISPHTTADLLDRTTLNALRALPRKGGKDMMIHIVERYLADSRELVASIERSIEQDDAVELARAAHAWRSYNGNVGAHGLASLCREIEDRARDGKVATARELLSELRASYVRVREELQFEMRRSA
jgi:CheY-like chemotaxis protein/HPt (histidine-containing phosphotransfer) domain-containing protein